MPMLFNGTEINVVSFNEHCHVVRVIDEDGYSVELCTYQNLKTAVETMKEVIVALGEKA